MPGEAVGRESKAMRTATLIATLALCVTAVGCTVCVHDHTHPRTAHCAAHACRHSAQRTVRARVPVRWRAAPRAVQPPRSQPGRSARTADARHREGTRPPRVRQSPPRGTRPRPERGNAPEQADGCGREHARGGQCGRGDGKQRCGRGCAQRLRGRQDGGEAGARGIEARTPRARPRVLDARGRKRPQPGLAP